PQQRGSQLGTISDALALLLLSPGPDSDLHNEITSEGVTRVGVTASPDLIQLQMPVTAREVTPLGIDQIVCTALGVQVQGGGSRSTKVQVWFTVFPPQPNPRRTCPLIK